MGHRAIRKGEAKGKNNKKNKRQGAIRNQQTLTTTRKSIRDRWWWWWNTEPDTKEKSGLGLQARKHESKANQQTRHTMFIRSSSSSKKLSSTKCNKILKQKTGKK